MKTGRSKVSNVALVIFALLAACGVGAIMTGVFFTSRINQAYASAQQTSQLNVTLNEIIETLQNENSQLRQETTQLEQSVEQLTEENDLLEQNVQWLTEGLEIFVELLTEQAQQEIEQLQQENALLEQSIEQSLETLGEILEDLSALSTNSQQTTLPTLQLPSLSQLPQLPELSEVQDFALSAANWANDFGLQNQIRATEFLEDKGVIDFVYNNIWPFREEGE
jgi:predicted PurR-regulated permease PerM